MYVFDGVVLIGVPVTVAVAFPRWNPSLLKLPEIETHAEFTRRHMQDMDEYYIS